MNYTLNSNQAVTVEELPTPKMQLAEIQLTRKTLSQERPTIKTSGCAFNLAYPYFTQAMETQELFFAFFLDRANTVMSVYPLSVGGICGTVVDLRLLFSSAILSLASAIIVCHNHPSGNTAPSVPDKEITKKIKEAAQLFDMKLLDHLIITVNDHYSFADDAII